MKIYTWIRAALLVAVIGSAGCTTSRPSSALLREGYRDIQIGETDRAERNARRILAKRRNDPAALVMLAQARMAAGDKNGALEALETLDYTNASDWAAPDRISLHEGYLMKAALSGDLKGVYRAEEIEKKIIEDMRARYLLTMVSYYEQEGDPLTAAQYFEQYEQIVDRLLPKDLMHGFVLYYSTFRTEAAKRLWAKLTPKQQNVLLARYEDIQF